MTTMIIPEESDIIYEPVLPFSGKMRRLWCVFDRASWECYYGKKKKYALQKYEKAQKLKMLKEDKKCEK